ncbi:MAG: hypothetical protein K0U74_06950 [Alphaproteobacteria bacterium]|nr:hypothetical protein [Alphaproteobacteria bacterium]
MTNNARPSTRRLPVTVGLASLISIAILSADPASAKRYSIPCGEVSVPELFQQIDQTYQQFAGKWLVIAKDWFSSYTVKVEQKNPLLPSKTIAKPVTGFVWLKSVTCIATRDTKAKTWTMRIQGRHIKFNEEGGGWVQAVKKGALAEYIFTQTTDGWTKTDRTAEVSVLGGDDAEKRPAAADLPPRIITKPKKKKK